MTPHFFQNIEGWFDFDDIYNEQVVRAKDGARFVEIGVYKGKSTAYMCVEIANSEKYIEFYAVDKFDWPVNGYEICRRNLGQVGEDYVDLIVDYSFNAATELFGLFDFIFIDASHEYEDVASDLLAWFPKLKKGGVIGGHDYANASGWGEFPGVSKAVHEFFDPKGLKVEVRRSSWLVRT